MFLSLDKTIFNTKWTISLLSTRMVQVHSYILSSMYASFEIIDHNFTSPLLKGTGYCFLLSIQVLFFFFSPSICNLCEPIL